MQKDNSQNEQYQQYLLKKLYFDQPSFNVKQTYNNEWKIIT